VRAPRQRDYEDFCYAYLVEGRHWIPGDQDNDGKIMAVVYAYSLVFAKYYIKGIVVPGAGHVHVDTLTT
jgi:hypothetical protein